MKASDAIGLPLCGDGTVPTITAVYENIGPANIMSCAHFPKMAVGVLYET